jgi:hypothetical protein
LPIQVRTTAFLPNDRRKQWLDRHAPWMNAPTRDYILSLGPHWYYPRPLGQYLELYNEDREKLQAWSVEAIDVTEEERRMINKEKNRKAQERRRRKNKAKPRAESLSRTKPWADEGISRSTWERRRRKAGDANPSRPSLTCRRSDELASSSKPQGTVTLPSASSEPDTPAVAGGAKIIPLFSEKPKQPCWQEAWSAPQIWAVLPDGRRRFLQDVEPIVLPLAA